jgi:hypothetical protein
MYLCIVINGAMVIAPLMNVRHYGRKNLGQCDDINNLLDMRKHNFIRY